MYVYVVSVLMCLHCLWLGLFIARFVQERIKAAEMEAEEGEGEQEEQDEGVGH